MLPVVGSDWSTGSILLESQPTIGLKAWFMLLGRGDAAASELAQNGGGLRM